MAVPALVPTRMEEVRRAFIEREHRPTYEELSVEFQVPKGSIGNAASDQSWPAMRAEYLESKLRQADAAEIMLEAVKVDRTLLRKAVSVALSALMLLPTVSNRSSRRMQLRPKPRH
jgi:hypothetical protein